MLNRLLILLIGISFVVHANGQEEYTLSDMNLLGKVKSIKKTWETVDSSIICIYGGGSEKDDYKNYFFNESGNLKEQRWSFGSDHAESIVRYNYNPQGKLMEKLITPLDTEIVSYLNNRYRIIYCHSENGLVETTVYFKNENTIGDTTSIVKYNGNGKVIERKGCSLSYYLQYDKKEYSTREVREYDLKGNCIELKFFDQLGVNDFLIKNYYDSNLRLVKRVSEEFTDDSDLKSIDTYKYDSSGNIIEQRCHYIRFGNLKGMVEDYSLNYDYEYDTNKNWTTKITRGEGYIQTVKRIIEYYE